MKAMCNLLAFSHGEGQYQHIITVQREWNRIIGGDIVSLRNLKYLIELYRRDWSYLE